MRSILAILIWIQSCLVAYSLSHEPDTLSGPTHWGVEAELQAGQVMVLDKYQRSYMLGKSTYSGSLKLNHVSLPSDSDAYAHDYHYPTFAVVAKFSKNNSATMHRTEDYPRWRNHTTDDLYEIVPYHSHLGNSLSLFGSFSYPFLRNRSWELSISGNLGLAYTARSYDKTTDADNDMIGSHLLFYAGAGVNATYRIAPSWGVKAGLDYWHISNGSTRQPNRSANVVGPTVGIIYYPYYETLLTARHSYQPPKYNPYWYLNIKGGVGVQTRIEDWDNTQYYLPKDHPDWRTQHFTSYAVASLQVDIMRRYARIGAVGGGIDIQYYFCHPHLRSMDHAKGIVRNHSPWSIALDAKHTFFYGNVSLALGGGVYLYKELGDFAHRHELPVFNRIGVHYTMPALHNLTAGIEVKAHLSKADFAELVISQPIILKRKK